MHTLLRDKTHDKCSHYICRECITYTLYIIFIYVIMHENVRCIIKFSFCC